MIEWPLSRLGIVSRFLIGGVVATGILWWGMDIRLSREISATTHKALQRELEAEARQDRMRFDQSLRSHFTFVRLLAGTESAIDHVTELFRGEKPVSPKVVTGEPDWLPPRVDRRAFPLVNFVLVLDEAGEIREISSLVHNVPPPSLDALNLRLLGSAMNQAYVIRLGDSPFILSVARIGKNGALIALLSRLDSRFLSFNHLSRASTGHIIAISEGQNRTIVASSDASQIPPGTKLDSLSSGWLLVGMEFFDYGSSEVVANFSTLVPQRVAEDRVRPILEQERAQRTLLAMAMSGLLVIVLAALTFRLRGVIAHVGRVSEQAFGVVSEKFRGGDELAELVRRVQFLTDEVVNSRARLAREESERLRLVTEHMAIEAENERLRLLFAVTDLLEVGVLRVGQGGAVAENPVMAGFAQKCRGLTVFVAAMEQAEDEVSVIDVEGVTRIFELQMSARLAPDLLLVTDVTKRRRTEDEIRNLALFPAQNPYPVLRIGSEGTVLHANPASKPLLAEWKCDIGQTVSDVWRRRVADIFRSGHRVTVECDVEGRTLALSFVPIPAANYINVYSSDVTSRVEVERLLANANETLERRVAERTEDLLAAKELAEWASRSKTEFLATVSHELRTPLNAIIGFSEVMASGLFGPMGNERYQGYAGDIVTSARHLLEVINDILDVSKIESGEMSLDEETVDIAELVSSSVRLIEGKARAGGVRLATRLDESLPHFFGDRRRLLQILVNLLSNAVKFTPAGGTVEAVAMVNAEGLYLKVTDTGIGMNSEEIEIALQPFRQVDGSLARRYEGTGLGLPLAKSLTEMHGGRLEVKSVPGIGTEVTVIVPMGRVADEGVSAAS